VAEIERIDAMGGAVRAIEDGYQKREIENAAYEHARRVDSGEQVVVGVNRYTLEEEIAPQLQRVDESMRDEQVARTAAVRASRDEEAVRAALAAVSSAAGSDENLLPHMREALRLRATLQEVCDVLRAEFGTHVPSESF
jgi:methylmalonyl-CoA mutase N-terminal domain/subunit